MFRLKAEARSGVGPNCLSVYSFIYLNALTVDIYGCNLRLQNVKCQFCKRNESFGQLAEITASPWKGKKESSLLSVLSCLLGMFNNEEIIDEKILFFCMFDKLLTSKANVNVWSVFSFSLKMNVIIVKALGRACLLQTNKHVLA